MPYDMEFVFMTIDYCDITHPIYSDNSSRWVKKPRQWLIGYGESVMVPLFSGVYLCHMPTNFHKTLSCRWGTMWHTVIQNCLLKSATNSEAHSRAECTNEQNIGDEYFVVHCFQVLCESIDNYTVSL